MFNLRNYGFSKPAALLTALMFSTGYASAQVQTVTGSLSVSELSAGQSTELTVSYTATDADGADAATTGLGLRLHFNSSVVETGDLASLLEEGASGNQIKDDTNDDDDDPLFSGIITLEEEEDDDPLFSRIIDLEEEDDDPPVVCI